MKILGLTIDVRLLSLWLFALLVGCQGAKKVGFETYVDTTSRAIEFQPRKTYSLDGGKVFVGNEFDGARLNGVEQLNDSTATIRINPENEPINHSAYYAFKIWSKDPRTFYLNLEYPEGHEHRYWPKLKKQGSWSVIDSALVSKNGSGVRLKLQLDADPLTVAAQELQTSTDVSQWYSALIANKPYVRPRNYGESMLGRQLTVLDMYKGSAKNKPIVVLLTRQHPPEVTGYFAFQEFMQTILNESALSDQFLNQYRVLAFPMLNPDGVDLGHWRHNAGGVDTNRDWSKYHQPEVRQVVNFIDQQLKKDRSDLVLGIDFHSTYEDVFYTNKIREGTTLPNFISDWFNALEAHIPNYKVNEASGNSTKPVSKGWFLYGHKAVGITYEIGDATPRDRIRTIGKVTAEQMMRILTNKQ